MLCLQIEIWTKSPYRKTFGSLIKLLGWYLMGKWTFASQIVYRKLQVDNLQAADVLFVCFLILALTTYLKKMNWLSISKNEIWKRKLSFLMSFDRWAPCGVCSLSGNNWLEQRGDCSLPVVPPIHHSPHHSLLFYNQAASSMSIP